MWQKFTEKGRRVVFFAQEEATNQGRTHVATEHLLLGLTREVDMVAYQLISRMGFLVSEIRAEVNRQAERGHAGPIDSMQLTPEGKRVIDLAYDEATRLSDTFIGTEHLLLGLLRDGDGLAGRILLQMGMSLDKARQEVANLRAGDDRQPGESESVGRELRGHGPRLVEVSRHFSADSNWRGRSLVSLADVSAEDFRKVLDAAGALKELHEIRTRSLRWSYPRTLGMIFEKPSLRTRVSFETGMAHLGGHAVYLSPGDIGLGSREPVAHVAMALSRWVDVISARVFRHETVQQLAANATVPVINALSDREHPIQAFADLLTLKEQKGPLGPHLKMAYVGDGNNVLHALLLACSKMGVNLSAACPTGYVPDPEYVRMAIRDAATTGVEIRIVDDPVQAVRNADAVYTDVWTSMGQEEETQKRREVFARYRISAELMAHAKPNAIVLHCLPAHCGEEITAEMFERHQSVIMDQAENRMHTQKALVALMVGI